MSDAAADMFVSLSAAADGISARPTPSAAASASASSSSAAGEGGGDDAPSLPPGAEMQGDVMVLPSLCVACEGEGTTRLLLTRIPFFKSVILMAFHCESCGYRNCEVQSAEVQPKGCYFEVTCTCDADLNRQVVKSDKGSVLIPELEFEIPSITQRGVFTTIEGLLERALENLNASQVGRRESDPDGAAAVDAFLQRLRDVREGRAFPFKFILDDASGNSFVENLKAPLHDPGMKVKYYTRTLEQSHALGCYAESAHGGMVTDDPEGEVALPMGEVADADDTDLKGSAAVTSTAMDGNIPGKFKKGGALIRNPTARNAATRAAGGAVRGATGRLEALVFDSSSSDAAKEVMRFPVDCFNCSAAGECRMCVTDVPHFKEVILMAFTCDECGWRNVEVKGGGAVPLKGTVTELRYDPTAPGAAQDMTRDLIKGDTASIEVPELSLVVVQGSLGGMYTTVEGLLTAVKEKLLEGNPFMHGTADSATDDQRHIFASFMDGLDDVVAGRVPFTLRLRDPMSNTWLYSPCAPAPDPRVTHTEYERTHEECVELGLTDMKTEDYSAEATAADAASKAAEEASSAADASIAAVAPSSSSV